MLVDIWRLWAEKAGVEITFRVSDWADTIRALETGEADIHSGLFRNGERSEWIDFSRPTYEISTNIYARTGEAPPPPPRTSPASRSASCWGRTRRRSHGSTIPRRRSYRSRTTKRRSSGAVDAALAEDPAASVLLDRMGLRGQITAAAQPVLQNELYFGVRKGEDALLGLIENGLDAISLDELAAIERRWIPRVEDLQFVDRPLLLSAEERAWLAEHPLIRVHNETNWEPFNFYESGRALGFSIDYMNLIAKKVGVEVEYVSGPTWDEFLGMIAAKDLDVMLNIVRTPARVEYILFTDRYVDIPVIVVRDESEGVAAFEDLFGRTLAIPRGFFYQEIIEREYPDIELLLLDGQLECLQAVAVARADATIGGIAVQQHLIEKHLLSNLKIVSDLPEGVFSNDLRIGVRDDWPMLRDILQKAVESVDPIAVQEIRRRWLGGASVQEDAAALLQLTAVEQRWLVEHPAIRLGVDPAYPPFEFIAGDGAYLGIAADYVGVIEDRLGVTLEVVPDLT